ncbi:hypothetical protein RRG08_010697 [Elysia crispata]|uniref:Protein unc-45 homolog B n=1 Tax=Elysia crispata TaxID=231223 RepID=A0AAE0YXN1_9GAST|nr:hypothetical protein RRG08_010697 [Elysia crispata]
MAEFGNLKEQGNSHFKAGDYESALKCYAEALHDGPVKDSEKAVVYKNRAACHLKLGDNKAAIIDASLSLDLTPNDPKALFRRCQAYEAQGKMEEAFKDVSQLIKVDPQNKAAQPLYTKLNKFVQDKMKQRNSTANKVSQMFNIAFDSATDKEKRLQGLNNLIVLAREDVGASMIVAAGGLAKLGQVLSGKDLEILQAAVRILGSLAKSSKDRCRAIVDVIGLAPLVRLMSFAETEEMASSVALLIQNLTTCLAGLDLHQAVLKRYEEDKKKGVRSPYPQLKLDDEGQSFLKDLFPALVKMLVSAKITGWGRDAAMELITKNVVSKEGADWTQHFLETQGVENLLTVAGTQKEFKTLPITKNSSMHASVALSKIYDDLINDKLREKFKEKCHEYFRDLFSDGIFESKIEAVAAISTLLQGPYEVGGMLLGLDGVTGLMFSLAETDNTQYQKVAVEAIVNSASKKEKCTGILKDAVPILKKLYQSGEDHIKVRALVGLCKLGSFMGTDASTQPMAEGSTLKLSRICRKFLVNATQDSDLRKWATEGLAYLTLDADIKEELVTDTQALTSIFGLAKESDRNMTYASVTVLVNLTNSYDKQEVSAEMMELAKFAKQHIPQEHVKDKPEFVSSRIQKLAAAGVINALVALSNTDSKNSRELLCRVYMALASEGKLRGLIIQQGGIKSLLQLMNNNTDAGSVLAAHALAKISVTSDPHFAFPGQRVYEVVRPLLSLLHPDCSGLQNFEALMGLTNLASLSESVRNRILTEKGIPAIEQYMYEEHDMLRRAATELMCNMVISEKVQDLFEGQNDRVKIMVLFAGEEDEALVRAATGSLAILSSRSTLCEKIVAVEPWLDILQVHAVSERPDIQHRACHILANVACAGQECAQKLAESPVMEVLSAVASDTRDPQAKLAKEAAQRALDQCLELGLIKENAQGKNPVHFLDILRAQLRKAREEEERKRKLEEEEEERRKKEEEEQRKKREEDFQNNQARAEQGVIGEEEGEGEVEEVEVERAEEIVQQGPKIRELTEDEIARLELEERLRVPSEELSQRDARTIGGDAISKVVKVEDVGGGESGHLMASNHNNSNTDSGGNGGGSPGIRKDAAHEDDENDLDEEELDRGDVWNDEAGLS